MADINATIEYGEKPVKTTADRLKEGNEALLEKQFSRYRKLGEDAEKKIADYREKLRKKTDQLLQKQEENEFKKQIEDRKKLEKQILEENRSAFSKIAHEFGKNIGSAVQNAANNIRSALFSSMDKTVSLYSQYYTKFQTRLQESGLNAQGIFDLTTRNASVSPYFKLTTVLDKVSQFIDAGITNNLTQRSFLASISDKIATTFDATQQSLLDIVRIQKTDTTASRLGLEANLNRLFNYYFGDTSYLSQQFDNVQQILIGATAQLGAERGVEFEYQAQKWLGALGASGVTGDTLSKIAQGIGYLGTGNITALQSDQSLQNLLVMASNRGGLNYTDLLTRGLNADSTNKLMYGLIDYIRSISGNNVVRAQYANLFGITLTDMKVIGDLQSSVINDLYKTTMSYRDTLDELESQLSQVSSRMHLSEKIDNVMDNILTSAGMRVSESAALYGTYRAAQLLESLTGGIKIPDVLALGTGLLFGNTIESAIKSTVMGIGLLGPLMKGINQTGSSLDYMSWATESSSGGTGFRKGRAGQLTTGTSTTTYVFNENKSGTQQAIFDEQQASGESITGKETTSEDEILTILRFLQQYFENGGSSALPLQVQVANYGLIYGRE